MKLKIIGSGGCVSTPKPCCPCKICKEAREKGFPYARTGCSLFIEDEKILIDTPEDNPLRQELFVMEEIIVLKEKYHISQVIMTHIEEDYGKSYDDYLELEKQYSEIHFAFDGMEIII